MVLQETKEDQDSMRHMPKGSLPRVDAKEACCLIHEQGMMNNERSGGALHARPQCESAWHSTTRSGFCGFCGQSWKREPKPIPASEAAGQREPLKDLQRRMERAGYNTMLRDNVLLIAGDPLAILHLDERGAPDYGTGGQRERKWRVGGEAGIACEPSSDRDPAEKGRVRAPESPLGYVVEVDWDGDGRYRRVQDFKNEIWMEIEEAASAVDGYRGDGYGARFRPVYVGAPL